MTEENRRAFRYQPYGKFGASYRPADLEGFARIKKQYELQVVLIAYSAFSLFVFLPHSGPIFLREGKFLLWGLVAIMGYVISSNCFVKSLEQVAPRQPFFQAFQDYAMNADFRLLTAVQVVSLLLSMASWVGLRSYPTHGLDGVVRCLELALSVFLELICAAMFAARGTRAAIRR
jgi:hypothetical protein